jgi:GDP-mannose 6-dehydrogenase
LKVAFGNEIGSICKALRVDSHEVMRIFCEDTKLNIAPTYLRPGFAFGGSCLPKDLRALSYRARQLDIDTPVLAAALSSNEAQIARAYEMVRATGSRRVGVLGLAFKAGTDDLRESPIVTLVERLIGKGMQLAIYDGHVSRANLIGSNREYIEKEIPHIWTLVDDSMDRVVARSQVVVIGNATPAFRQVEAKRAASRSMRPALSSRSSKRSACDHRVPGLCIHLRDVGADRSAVVPHREAARHRRRAARRRGQ